MKKFYEAPVVELTGFSAEDVITTSAIAPVTPVDAAANKDAFIADVATQYGVDVANVSTYNW